MSDLNLSITDDKKIKTSKLLSKALIYAFAIFGLIFVVILFLILGMLRPQGKTVLPVPNSAILREIFLKFEIWILWLN